MAALKASALDLAKSLIECKWVLRILSAHGAKGLSIESGQTLNSFRKFGSNQNGAACHKEASGPWDLLH